MQIPSWLIIVITIDAAIWLATVIFIYRSSRSSYEKRKRIIFTLGKMLLFLGRFWWVHWPEEEEEEKRRPEAEQQRERSVGVLAIEFFILAIAIAAVGVLAGLSGEERGLYASYVCIFIAAPMVALFSSYLFLLWYLMRLNLHDLLKNYATTYLSPSDAEVSRNDISKCQGIKKAAINKLYAKKLIRSFGYAIGGVLIIIASWSLVGILIGSLFIGVALITYFFARKQNL